MEEVKTWQAFGALSDEQLAGYTPEDLASLKTTIAENETNLAKEKEEEASKLRKNYEDQKVRAEKAEKEAKGKVVPETTGSLSTKDVLYLAKADIHEEDLEEVTKQAKLQGITVSEAHKYMKPILDARNEERKTALATQTGRSQRGITKTTGEDLLAKAETTGEMPDDDEGMQKLATARLNKKVKG